MDIYKIGDEAEQLAEWDPKDKELPGAALIDPDWLRKRQLAIRFFEAEISREQEKFDREVEIVNMERERLRDSFLGIVKPMESNVASLKLQLEMFHRSKIAEAERENRKVPSTIKTVHGRLRSGDAPVPYTVSVVPKKFDEAVAWLREHRNGAAIRVKEDVDVTEARKLVDDDGKITDPNGASCPWLVVAKGERWFKQDS